jgi:hypothetical protein
MVALEADVWADETTVPALAGAYGFAKARSILTAIWTPLSS